MDDPNPLVYERILNIRSEQVDMSRHLRMSELFRLLEEASIAHTELLGCPRQKTLDRGLLWIITRQLVEIDELPAYDDDIIVRSWQGDMQHVFFPRFYEIEREGRVLVRGQALWMLMDEASRTMVMPEDYGISIPGRPGSDDMALPAVTIPKTPYTSVSHADRALNKKSTATGQTGTANKKSAGCDSTTDLPVRSAPLAVRFSQVDINGHMNNTRYFDIIDDALHSATGGAACISDNSGGALDSAIDEAAPLSFAGAVPKRVLANYLSELRLADRFTLDIYENDGTLVFEGAADRPYFRIRYDY